MFQLVNQNNMDLLISWNKWANFLEDKTARVLKCILCQISGKDNIDSKDEDIDYAIAKIEEEILYLQKSPDKKSIFWNSKELIDACKNQLLKNFKKLRKILPLLNEHQESHHAYLHSKQIR